jgi:2-polyprenyl-3-methyl-5-hydroxy-6-metoxy-1,4-benzoquinol methylase
VKQFKKYIVCPVCSGEQFSSFKTIKDHMITKEDFDIVSCDSCGFHFTNPIPLVTDIGNYYKSEDYISHSSSKKGLVNSIYGIVRSITLKQKVSLVKKRATGISLLDIGAGTGHFLNQAKTAGFTVQGLEPDQDAVQFAYNNFQLRLDSLKTLYTIESESKDVITMWHVLEHVYQLNEDLSEMNRVLNKSGLLIIAVPNMDSYDAKKYGAYWAAFDVPRHLYHFQKNTIQQLLEKHHFSLLEILPMKFDSFYVSMLSEKYKGGNLLNGVLTGFKSNLKAKKQGFSSQIYVFKKN